MDSDILKSIGGAAIGIIFLFVIFVCVVVVAYVLSWMLETWFGFCSMDYDMFRAILVALGCCGGLFRMTVHDD